LSKAQVSMEYILIATVVLVASIPTFYIGFKNFQSLSTTHEENKINSYLAEVIDNAELIYFNGLYSKITIEPKIKPKYNIINHIYTIEANTTHSNYVYYLVLNITDNEKEKILMFNSQVPLKSNSSCFIDSTSNYFSECTTSHTCKICNLSIKHFLVQPLSLQVVLNDTILKVELLHNIP
jgi:uncharacterized protein (UPF0333 family)